MINRAWWTCLCKLSMILSQLWVLLEMCGKCGFSNMGNIAQVHYFCAQVWQFKWMNQRAEPLIIETNNIALGTCICDELFKRCINASLTQVYCGQVRFNMKIMTWRLYLFKHDIHVSLDGPWGNFTELLTKMFHTICLLGITWIIGYLICHLICNIS